MYENAADLRIGGILDPCAKLVSQSLSQVNKSNLLVKGCICLQERLSVLWLNYVKKETFEICFEQSKVGYMCQST